MQTHIRFYKWLKQETYATSAIPLIQKFSMNVINTYHHESRRVLASPFTEDVVCVALMRRRWDCSNMDGQKWKNQKFGRKFIPKVLACSTQQSPSVLV